METPRARPAPSPLAGGSASPGDSSFSKPAVASDAVARSPARSDDPLLFVVGLNEGALGGSGWHARTRDGRCGVATRPLEPEAFWRVDPSPSWRRDQATLRVSALLCAAPSLLGQSVDVFLWGACVGAESAEGATRSAELTWRAVAEWRFETDVWCWRDSALELAEIGGARWKDDAGTRLLLRLDTTPEFVPARRLGNRDYRPMGVQWGALRLERAKPTHEASSSHGSRA